MQEIKKPEDMVILKNISECEKANKDGVLMKHKHEPVTYTWNGTPYTVTDKRKCSRREAEHAVKNSRSYYEDRYRLEIEELPLSERDPSQFTVSDEKLKEQSAEIDGLKDRVKELEKENVSLRAELADLKGEEPGKKKPGRPKGS